MKKKIFVFVLFFLLIFQVWAQVKINGKVIDESGIPIPGVTVLLKGTTIGTVTQINGSYALDATNQTGTLVFSFIGMESVERNFKGSTSIDVVMTTTVIGLDEVVAIGYGTSRKRDLTGAVSFVKSEDIVKAPTNNALEAIQGMVPGMLISRESGAAGSGVNILIRGNRSINGSNSPLFIIDGVQGGSFSDLNASDIESINVLKDASSTAIYGSQGANGVVIISTKKGKIGKTKVSYNAYYGVNGFTRYPPANLRDDYIALRREAYRAAGVWNSSADDESIFEPYEWDAIQNDRWINWQNLLQQNGMLQNHVANISGGNEKTRSMLSIGYMNEGGMYKNDNMDKYNFRLSIDHDLASWVKIGLNAQLTYYDLDRRDDPMKYTLTTTPFAVPFDENGNINTYPVEADLSIINPLADEAKPNIAVNNSLTTKNFVHAYLDINPLAGLNYRTNVAVNLSSARNGKYYDAASIRQNSIRIPQSSVNASHNRYINWDNILNYSKELGGHSVKLTALTSYTKSAYDYVEGRGTGQMLASQLFYFLEGNSAESQQTFSGYEGTSTFSIAGRLNYSYKGKYLLTVSQRYDGASRLAEGHKWASFPSVALAWRVEEEGFMQNLGAISNLKIRASYGIAGNSGIDPYGTQTLVYLDSQMSYGDIAAPGYKMYQVGNKELGWEKSASTNIGLDLGLFKNRVNATIDLYNTETTDILMARNLPPSTGVGITFQNIGATNNKGIEISLNTVNVQTGNFKWESSLTFSKNNEKITALIDGEDIYNGGKTQSLMIGHPIQSWYNWTKAGIWQEGEEEEMAKFVLNSFEPGDIKIKDVNGDYAINNEDRMYVGSAVPKWEGGLQNTFEYKGIDLSVYLYARIGQTIFGDFLGRYNPSGEGNGPAIFDYWTPENPTNSYPRPYKGQRMIDYYGYETLLFVDGSYVKLKNISLGYTLPKNISRKVYMEKLRFYATVSNVMTFVKTPTLKYYDPERGGSEDSPLSRQVVFGVNIDF